MMEEENIFDVYKENSKCIESVKIDDEKLLIVWPTGQKEIFYMKDLKSVAIITTDERPMQPDVFWLLMFKIPIMVPSDEWIPGSLAIAHFFLNLPNFDHKKFIKAMCSTSNNAFELWDKRTQEPNGKSIEQ